MLSSLFFLDAHGEPVIELQYRDKISRTLLEIFWNTYVATHQGATTEASAVVVHSGHAFAHIRRNNLFLLGISRQDDAALAMLEELVHIADILEAYLKDLTEDVLRENFSTVYQLLLEILDYGYPLTTDLFSLEELVPKPTLESKMRSILESSPALSSGGLAINRSAPIPASTVLTPSHSPLSTFNGNGATWRDPSTFHTTNELLIDVVEYLDYIVDTDGRTVRSSVHGAVKVNCRLSGMPEVLVRLVSTDTFDEVGFHRSVLVPRYERDRAVNFVPPEGRFTLLQYVCKPIPPALSQIPFYVAPQVHIGEKGGRFNCMAGLRTGATNLFKGTDGNVEVQQVSVRLVLPPHTKGVSIQSCSSGITSFDRTRSQVVWTIGNLTSGSTVVPSLSGEFTVEPPSSSSSLSFGGAKTTQRGAGNSRGKASAMASAAGGVAFVSFVIKNQTMSSVRVDSVQILNETGKTYKGVKYATQSGNFVVRFV